MFYWLQQLYGNIERAFTKKIFARFGPNHHYNTLSSVISYKVIHWLAGPRGRAVKGVGLRPLASWDCGFESHRGNGCLVCCECCVLLGTGLYDELMTRQEESYRMWCGVVCDIETSWMRRPWPTGGCCVKRKQNCLVNVSCCFVKGSKGLRITLRQIRFPAGNVRSCS